VKSGYRITLTYNLVLRGDISRPAGDAGTIAELTDLLREHFSTPAPRYYGGHATEVPNRLVYVHSRIDAAELPVTHVTRRQGALTHSC
jgi:hypothetical protein